MENTVLNLKKEHCTGCAACFNICPADAIRMVEDDEGFVYPKIDSEKCRDCGLCEKICPALHVPQKHGRPASFAIQAKDSVRWVSSSGGMFTLCSDRILDQDGYVCGAAFDEGWRGVHHEIINDWRELPRLMRSKYTQSVIGDVYKRIKNILETEVDKPALFCGCPCQVAGLKNYLGKEYDKLYLLDLLCHGIGSPKAHRAFLKQRSLAGADITDFHYKCKDKGWGAVIKIDYSDGYTHFEGTSGTFYKTYLADLNVRMSCQNCPYVGLERISDISIADYWGINKITDGFSDNMGTSLVLINTPKGEKLLDEIRPTIVNIKETEIEKAIPFNRPLKYPTPKNEMREVFFRHLDIDGFDEAARYALHEGRYDVGIVGWWNGTNFGSTLTSFAIYRTLISMGLSPVFVTPPNEVKNDPPIPYLTDFSRKNFRYTLQRYPYEMSDLNNYCDLFLVASDQLWYYKSFIKNGFLFMLNFAEDRKKKISYATSFAHGESLFPENQAAVARYYLQKFDYISVRENDGVDICRDTFGVEAEWVLDPVFLCDKSEYIRISEEAGIKTEGSFIFAYILDPTPEKIKLMQFISEKLNKRIVTFTDPQSSNPQKAEVLKDFGYVANGTINDWIWHLINCDFSIVDSYHGMCFSIIFSKQFVSMINRYRGLSRFTSLAKMFEIEDKLVFDPLSVMEDASKLANIDYEKINKILERERKRCRDKLETELKTPKANYDYTDRDMLLAQLRQLEAKIKGPYEEGYLRCKPQITGKLTRIGNCVIDMHPTAKITINGELVLNAKLPHGSQKECCLVLEANTVLTVNGYFEIAYDSVVRLVGGAHLTVGRGHINSGANVSVKFNTTIGDGFLCGKNLSFWDSDMHRIIDNGTGECINAAKRPVRIGKHVWIGTDVTILKECEIGDNCVIGARSVVTKSIPPNSLAVGAPAKVVRENINWSV